MGVTSLSWIALSYLGFYGGSFPGVGTGEGMAARFFFWLPVAVCCSIGCAKRYWVASSERWPAWRAGLLASSLVLLADTLFNFVLWVIVMRNEPAEFLGWPVLVAVLVAPISLLVGHQRSVAEKV